MSAHDPIDPTPATEKARQNVEELQSEIPVIKHETDPTSAMGGLGGAAIGAAAGSLGGPIGIAIGALAGAVGGWWAGRSIAHAAHEYEHDESRFRERHGASAGQHDYETARPAYQLGYLAGRNPDYRTKTFEDVEEHVQLGWSPIAASIGPWPSMREYARDAYDIGQQRADQFEREVPITRAVDAESSSDRSADIDEQLANVDADASADLDEQLANADSDPIAHPTEPAEAVYPSEIDALANGIPAEPGSEAAREFGIGDSEIRASEAELETDEAKAADSTEAGVRTDRAIRDDSTTEERF